MRKPWRMMTEAEKERQREYSRRYRARPEGKRKMLECKRRWNAKNREKKNAQDRAWYARHKSDPAWMADKIAVKKTCRARNPERYKANMREWYEAHIEYHRTYMMLWRKLNRERMRELQRAYRARHREELNRKCREYRKAHPDKTHWARMKLRFARDAAAYAKHRERERMRYAKRVAKSGRVYTPTLSRRIPDHVPFGVSSALAARSVFVWENLGAERQRELSGFARDLYIERKKWRMANGER